MRKRSYLLIDYFEKVLSTQLLDTKLDILVLCALILINILKRVTSKEVLRCN